MLYPQRYNHMASKTHTSNALQDKAKHGHRIQEPWPISKGSGPLKCHRVHSSEVSREYLAEVPLSLDGSCLTENQSTFT